MTQLYSFPILKSDIIKIYCDHYKNQNKSNILVSNSNQPISIYKLVLDNVYLL